MKEKLKPWLFSLLGKDPEGVVVVAHTGARSTDMFAEMRRLVPDRRVLYCQASTAAELREFCRPWRVAQLAVLFDSDPAFDALRWAAFRLAPTKILAFHADLERHHLRLRHGIASLLFLRGLPVDRIFLRPRWLYPFKRDRSVYPDTIRVLDGRPASAARRPVSVLTPYFPYPLAHGGAVRIFNLLRACADEFDIRLFAFTEPDERIDAGPVLEWAERVILVEKPRYREPRWSTLLPPEVHEYESPAMRRALREHRRGPLQAEYTALGRYAPDVLVEHDVTFDLQAQVARRDPSSANRWNHWRWRRFEEAAVARAREAVVMSAKDQAMLGRGVIIENGVDLARFTPAPETSGRRVLFIGSFRHFPNVTAARWFLDQVWPHVPNAELEIVAGPEFERYWTPSARPDVTVHGFVADVRPLYHRAHVVVTPTLVSAGTNLKVIEAMAMERAVVSTTSGVGGLDLGPEIWVEDDPEAFAQAVNRLLDDGPRRHALAQAARRVAEERFGWDRLAEKQRSLWRGLA